MTDSAEEFLKIGVSFPISEPALLTILEINRKVAQLTSSVVVFGANGNSSPHVTIAMGTLHRSSISNLAADVRRLTVELPRAVDLSFGPSYRETTTGRYIFADVFLDPVVLAWRQEAQARLAKSFAEVARTSEEPHLTLAHVEANQTAADRYLAAAPRIPDCRVRQIDVALSGSKGRKLQVLDSVSLD